MLDTTASVAISSNSLFCLLFFRGGIRFLRIFWRLFLSPVLSSCFLRGGGGGWGCSFSNSLFHFGVFLLRFFFLQGRFCGGGGEGGFFLFTCCRVVLFAVVFAFFRIPCFVLVFAVLFFSFFFFLFTRYRVVHCVSVLQHMQVCIDPHLIADAGEENDTCLLQQLVELGASYSIEPQPETRAVTWKRATVEHSVGDHLQVQGSTLQPIRGSRLKMKSGRFWWHIQSCFHSPSLRSLNLQTWLRSLILRARSFGTIPFIPISE